MSIIGSILVFAFFTWCLIKCQRQINGDEP